MRRSSLIAAVIGVIVILSVPVLSASMASPRAAVQAHILTREPVNIDLLPPISFRTDWYGGAVIPIKVMITDQDENGILGANITIWVNGQAATGPGKAFAGNVMMDFGGGLYQYNLNTKPYPAGPGSSPITITISVKTLDDRTAQRDVLMSLD